MICSLISVSILIVHPRSSATNPLPCLLFFTTTFPLPYRWLAPGVKSFSVSVPLRSHLILSGTRSVMDELPYHAVLAHMSDGLRSILVLKSRYKGVVACMASRDVAQTLRCSCAPLFISSTDGLRSVGRFAASWSCFAIVVIVIDPGAIVCVPTGISSLALILFVPEILPNRNYIIIIITDVRLVPSEPLVTGTAGKSITVDESTLPEAGGILSVSNLPPSDLPSMWPMRRAAPLGG